MKAVCFVLCFIASGVRGIPVKIEQCGGGEAPTSQVLVDPCEKEICQIPLNTTLTVTANFVANQDASKIRLLVETEIGGVRLAFPGLPRNGCEGYNIQCPIKKGDNLQLIVPMFIRPFFPTIETSAHFTLEGPEGKMMCFDSHVQIVKGEIPHDHDDTAPSV